MGECDAGVFEHALDRREIVVSEKWPGVTEVLEVQGVEAQWSRARSEIWLHGANEHV